MIWFVTVNYYSTHLIATLIQSIQIQQDADYRLVVVNNSPDDLTISTLESPSVQLIQAGTNLGFGQACNLALEWIHTHDSQAIVWLINPDAYLKPDSLREAFQFFLKHPEVSILGTIIYEPMGKIWFGGGTFKPLTGEILVNQHFPPHSDTAYQLAEWVSGCSLLINLQRFIKYPQFDPHYFLYYEDFDLCKRYAQAGHIIAFTTEFGIVHQPSSITSQNLEFKLECSIFSYLLSLYKYTFRVVLWYRLLRITFVALLTLPLQPSASVSKLKGVASFWQWLKQMEKTH